MTRGPQHAGRGKGAPSATCVEPSTAGAASPIDLGIALSVYGKTPQGRLVEIDASAPAPSELDTWSTEQ
jgi:hypothetical protein